MMAGSSRSGNDHTTIDIVDKTCIFKVPKVLRRQNPEAYTPDTLLIGPFHHYGPKEEGTNSKDGKAPKKEDFQLMERVKQRYLKELLAAMGNINLEGLKAKLIEISNQKNEGKFEDRARNFYSEPLDHIPPKDFIDMMTVDGCFLVQLFRKCNREELRAFDDPVFNMDCMFHFLCHDLLLLENQLPWFIIEILYDLTVDKIKYPDEPSLAILILKAFSILPTLKHNCSSFKQHIDHGHCHCCSNVLHLLDLIRASIIVPLKIKGERAQKRANQVDEENELHSMGKNKREKKVTDNKRSLFDPDDHQMHTATVLSKADISFSVAKKQRIMDIRFIPGGVCTSGVLTIPQLNVGMLSETLFRNLIAIEQCYHGYSNEITSYAIFMDNLISSNEDMEILCKAKIIGNWLSDEDGCKFFKDLYKDIPHNKFYYADLCKEMNGRYKMRRFTWLASLKSEKFSNPWKILAFGIGIVVLCLTLWSQTNNIRNYLQK